MINKIKVTNITQPFMGISYRRKYSGVVILEDSEYPLIGKDMKEFLWTCVVPRKYKKLTNENAAEKLLEATVEYDKFMQFTKDIKRYMDDNYHVLNFQTGKTFTTILDALFMNWRGMYKLSTDLRRNKEILDELTRKFFVIGSNAADLNTEYGSSETEAADFYFPFMAHTILSAKQFEHYFCPALKFIYDFAEKYDKIGYIMIQGASDWLWDYLEEAPKGKFVYQFEMDDIFKAKKRFDNKVCIAGGFPVELLGKGTREECVDYAKMLIDRLGYDGAYLFVTNKMLAFPRDAKRENLIAINEYVAEKRLS